MSIPMYFYDCHIHAQTLSPLYSFADDLLLVNQSYCSLHIVTFSIFLDSQGKQQVWYS
jgi:hypothetical protein